MDDLQFIPTTKTLAGKAWRKFKNQDFTRVCDPSAGNGDLLEGYPFDTYHRGKPTMDACEIDLSRHAVLRARGYSVVGLDFLQFGSGNIYSHFLLNPPFNSGAKHVLHAWEVLWDGEIVAILNAETIRNPYSVERQHLVNLIAQHGGEVEYLKGEFATREAQIKTDVEIALVWLRKTANANSEIIGDVLGSMKADRETGAGLAGNYAELNELAHVNSTVENLVLMFNAAVHTMKASVFAQARANYYSSILGDTMAITTGNAVKQARESSVNWVRAEIGKHYLEIKDQAWTQVIRSTQVTDKLSSNVQRELESQFEDIKKLEFTASNIYGFLLGLVQNQGTLQIDMICEVFDAITRYHTDNLVFYKGWKSNDRHRTCGMRLKTTRFVLPHHKTESWSRDFSWETQRLLSDFDKVFALVDGKSQPQYSLVACARQNFSSLRDGERVSSSYFDLRYYRGTGTLHFFPRDKKLVDRLNRMVGKHRKWLPPDTTRVSENFWEQYDKAEKFDKELRDMAQNTKGYGWGPLEQLSRGDRDGREREFEQAQTKVDDCLTAVLERHGISVDFRIEHESEAPAAVQTGQLALLELAKAA